MPMSSDRSSTLPAISAITVEAPGRLHMGFLDPNGSLGRAFGSVGIVIEGCGTRVTARHADDAQVEGTATDAQRERVERYLALLHDAYGGPAVSIEVEQAARAHCGIGSGTQLALAVGTAYARLAGIAATTAELAQRLGRGARSGIGVLGFDHGGLIVDGGRHHAATAASPGAAPQSAAALPPLLARQPFPDDWRIVLIDDTTREGLHGDEEKRGLAALPPFPHTLAAEVCHQLLMRVLPGMAQGDFDAFAAGVSDIQQSIGEYFAPVQGGVYSSPAVAAAMQAIAANQTAGVGQSSWGPTGFAFVQSSRHADDALAAARAATRAFPGIVCSVTRGRNCGARYYAVQQPRFGIDAQ
ncbi:beta-ribofuranosylaminobenzene 5'-phosphate synthase family protein [Paraburkholderia phymatum]|uniref:Beta-ribofuranosylaminobenzene 5'-phosphate synthase family n=1 Tax=Paraburkholderia phymatum (strain DSM 17167 / CIP 108236 / LMG 21445 / STM815) TaxID=391038 RepID=B2JX34_PARP8|nr:beta-ribofuranosylaminobenzene 5'-phosphate synthase family protein [Paraburkholderia phymatum]ACC75511.1 beta-ribofuranosylaminobenzene 5'-phosphate synthase family [Paraburkholderia phymatum STM815]